MGRGNRLAMWAAAAAGLGAAGGYAAGLLSPRRRTWVDRLTDVPGGEVRTGGEDVGRGGLDGRRGFGADRPGGDRHGP